MRDFPEVIHHDTPYFTALYDPERDTVELSDYMTQFPLLWEHVLLHELDHSIIQRDSGLSLRHAILEFRCKIDLCRNPTIIAEYFRFMKLSAPHSWKQRLFYMVYKPLAVLSMFIFYLGAVRVGLSIIWKWIERRRANV